MKKRKSALMRHVGIIFSTLALVIASSIVTATPASASSVYDTAYTSLNQLQVSQNHFYNSSSCGATDLTYNWQAYILDPSAQLATGSGYNTDYATLRSSFETALASGSYAVSVNMDTAPTSGQYMESAIVYWTDDGDAQLHWTTSSSYPLPTHYAVDMTSAGGHIHFAQIGNEAAVIGSGGCKVGWGYPDTTNYSNLSSFYNYLSTDNWTSPPSGSYHASANLLVVNATLNLPTTGGVYEGEPIADSVLWASYVALGDSYSSGQGSGSYDIPGDGCYRSSDSYPSQLASVNYLAGLQPPDLSACSGAITDDLWNSNAVNTNEPAQVSHLSSVTQIVTLTIGGDDLGFKDVVGSCFQDTTWFGSWGCSGNSTTVSTLDNELDALEGSAIDTPVDAEGTTRPIHTLSDVIQEIADYAPNAQIYIAGYPHLFGSSVDDYDSDLDAPGYGTCSVGYYLSNITIDYTDAQWLNDRVDELDGYISDAASAEKALGIDVTYVAPSGFATHGLCDSSTPYINGVDETGFIPPATAPESLHPTTGGMAVYAAAFEAAINNHP